MSSNPQAYLTFKKGASINRTLVKNHYKDKVKTGIELRTEKIMRLFDLHEKNKKTLKRLEQENELMKEYNMTMYRHQKRELGRIQLSQKNGATPDQVA